MQRIRNLDELTYASCGGFSNTSGNVIARSYPLAPNKVLGRKKVTVDYPRPLRDYRYDMIPTVKNKQYRRISYRPSTYLGRKAKYGGKRVKSHVTVTYTRFVNLKRPKRPDSSTNLVRLNDFQVAQVLGYSTVGVLKTPALPNGWTTWYLTGPFAVEGLKDPNIQSAIGFDPFEISRPLTQDSSYANAALQRSMGKVSAPDVDFAEIVGELDQLTHLVNDPLKTLGNLLRKFQRYMSADAWILTPRRLPSLGKLNPKRLAYNALDVPTLLSGPLSFMSLRTRRKVGRRKVSGALVTEAANRWLQYRYGIVPLVGDITEILAKFQAKIQKLVSVQVAKSTVVAKRTTKVWRVIRPSVVPGFTLTYEVSVSTFDRYTAKVYYRSNLLDKYVDLRDLGLDSSNILPVTWELTRWSFIVDWFVGVGSWFRSWNVDPKLMIIGNCVSRKRDVNYKISIVSATYNGYSCQVPKSRYYGHRAELCRLTNLPVPEYPVFNPDFLKWRRVLDTISLLWAKMPALRR